MKPTGGLPKFDWRFLIVQIYGLDESSNAVIIQIKLQSVNYCSEQIGCISVADPRAI